MSSSQAGPYGSTGFTWKLEHDLALDGLEFSFREKKKGKVGRLPAVKGNTPKIIKIGRGYSVSPNERTVAAGKALVALLGRVSPSPTPIQGPVRLEVDFVFEPAASWSKRKRAAAYCGSIPCVEQNRGDLEQLLKLLNDSLERAGFFANDAQVVEVAAAKVYGPRQGYRLRLWSRVLA